MNRISTIHCLHLGSFPSYYLNFLFPYCQCSDPNTILLYFSSFFSVQGFNLEKFFHWAFPNPNGSGYPSTLHSFLVFIDKLEPEKVPTSLNCPQNVFKMIHLNGEDYFWEWIFFGDFCCFPALGIAICPTLLSPTQFLAPVQLLFLHGSFCSKGLGPTHVMGFGVMPCYLDLLSMGYCS